MTKIRLDNRPVGPFPALLVGAIKNEKPTYTTVGAGGCACLEPVLCVSLKNTHYITEAIADSGYFSVNIPAVAQVREVDLCGIVTGWQADKSGLFTPFYDAAGPAPLIEECPLNFLCRVCDSLEIRGFTMFFGDIAAAFADEACLSQGQPDPQKIDPLIMMAMHYCGLQGPAGRLFAEGQKSGHFSALS